MSCDTVFQISKVINDFVNREFPQTHQGLYDYAEQGGQCIQDIINLVRESGCADPEPQEMKDVPPVPQY